MFWYSGWTDGQTDKEINPVWASLTTFLQVKYYYYKSGQNSDRLFPTGSEQTQNRFRTDSEIFKVGIVERFSCNFP
jgi:hypothetical protein